ncbi:hypothetical protein GW931_02165 [archaeon]|nr:hypothetical protein [archaeon]PJC45611.1 MAG: hypothetical protein CO037_00675 [Candidatus Pacearchaeota archaeon CG_4_9_14_0_2_um_filter_30_8]
MKKQEKILSILLLILVVTFLILSISNLNLTGNAVLEKYAYTKAICNNSGYCEDFLIECNGQNLDKLTPTGFAIESNNQENLNEILCD